MTLSLHSRPAPLPAPLPAAVPAGVVAPVLAVVVPGEEAPEVLATAAARVRRERRPLRVLVLHRGDDWTTDLRPLLLAEKRRQYELHAVRAVAERLLPEEPVAVAGAECDRHATGGRSCAAAVVSAEARAFDAAVVVLPRSLRLSLADVLSAR